MSKFTFQVESNFNYLSTGNQFENVPSGLNKLLHDPESEINHGIVQHLKPGKYKIKIVIEQINEPADTN